MIIGLKTISFNSSIEIFKTCIQDMILHLKILKPSLLRENSSYCCSMAISCYFKAYFTRGLRAGLT